ncbi:MAG TPA: response regulator [Novosphingobium sp.]|nr:response regulator [Novosphingobium sp.]
MDSGRRCVLVLEDSVLVAMALEAALVDRGFDVIVAGSLAAANERVGRVDLAAALLDLQLPDGSSVDLARSLHARGCPVAICSGVDSNQGADALPFARKFLKPVGAETLAAWVCEVTGGP